MDNDNQIFIPDSFSTLHATPGGRPTLPRAELVARYELCEDMANALVEHCQAIHFRDGVDEAEALPQGLAGRAGGADAAASALGRHANRRAARLAAAVRRRRG